MAHRYTVDEVYRSVVADVIDRVRGDFVAEGVAECVVDGKKGGEGGALGCPPPLPLSLVCLCSSPPACPSFTLQIRPGRPVHPLGGQAAGGHG